MPTHELGRLIHLVDTAYYQQGNKKAVLEVLGKAEDNRIWISLFVNGSQVSGASGTLGDMLKAQNLNTGGWTTKPQQP